VDYLTKIDGEGEPGDPPAPTIPFDDPDPFQEQAYVTAIAAKRAIASYLGTLLAKLSPDQMEALNRFLEDTLEKTAVRDYVRTQLRPALSAER
jgi:hypothetical protein